MMAKYITNIPLKRENEYNITVYDADLYLAFRA